MRSKLFIKRPGPGGRASYAIIGWDGKTVRDSRIDSVNKDLRSGRALDSLEQRMGLILASLRPKERLVSDTNAKVIEDLHSWKCKRKPLNVDNDNLKYPLLRAAEFLAEISLHTSSEDQILTKLSLINDPGQRYRTAKALNEMLAFLKRDFRIYNPKPPRPEEIVFIRIATFLQKLPELLNPDWQLYLAGLFATGCRLGELPTVKYDGHAAHIARQVDSKGRIRVTKNKVSRTAPLLPPLTAQVEQLKRLGVQRITQIRMEEYSGMYKAFKKVFGLRLHDLRHSYAVEWGAVGASTSDIARYIGDTEEVCRRHYRNYCAVPDEILRAVERFKK
jgi:integrase